MIVLKNASNVTDIVQPVAILKYIVHKNKCMKIHIRHLSILKWFLYSSVDKIPLNRSSICEPFQRAPAFFASFYLPFWLEVQSFVYITTCSDFQAAAISVSDLSLQLPHVRRSTSCHIDTQRHTFGSHIWGTGSGSPYSTGQGSHTGPGCCPTGSRSHHTPGSS